MQVIKNAVHVGISRVSYMYFAHGIEADSLSAFKDTVKYSIGSVCIGSILEPFFTAIQDSACAMNSITGDTDEFMFSCTNCYSGVARRLVINKDHATAISLYAFLIGYFMSRITMSWPQACVSAYYVVYAENPESLRFDTTIPVRIKELQQSPA
ncbi:hypothetical protein MKW94_018694 [Papaver nudicaule]|uniref:Choline transporter-like protein n=1 Tax=Papaver nudicaule TaxID=74823 RepID=A0AA41VIQ0_PAPNU|nr:hypothetical protein [Papaver nudicaule]